MTTLANRAGIYLCLSRAFLPPREPRAYEAMARYLADDLDDLGAGASERAARALCDLRDAVASMRDHPSLLAAYSTLFLAPPARVAINAGRYLDGGLMGPAVSAIERCYGTAGFRMADDFGDLPDHIALQLEFVARLFADEAEGKALRFTAREFLACFVHHWLPLFVAALVRGCAGQPAGRVYLCLARLLQAQVEDELEIVNAKS